MIVTINPLPDCTITALASVCAGSEGNDAGVKDAGLKAKYEWSITGGTITSTEPYTNAIKWTAGPDAGSVTLSVKVTNGDDCASDTCTKQVTISKPDCTITASNTACSGATGLTASAPAGWASYSWSIDNGDIVGPDDAQSITFNAGTTSITKLTVTVKDANGCSNTCEKSVTVNPLPDCTISSPDTICPDSTGNTASVPFQEGATYKWVIVSGGTITSADNMNTIEWTADTTGKAILKVTVTKQECSKECSKEVRIVYTPGCLHPGGKYEIKGIKFNDLNGNGQKDDSEPGLAGWTINLEHPAGTVVNTQTTAPDGSYKFEQLFPLTYTVREVLQDGWVQTAPPEGYAQVTLTEEDPIKEDIDFGNLQKPTLLIQKSADPTTGRPGSIITHTITVKNDGLVPIEDIEIFDNLGVGWNYEPEISRDPASEFSGNALIWHLTEPLQPGETKEIEFKASISPVVCKGQTIIIPPSEQTDLDGKLGIMSVGSDPAELQQIMDGLARNKTKLEAKLDAIKNHRDAFDKIGDDSNNQHQYLRWCELHSEKLHQHNQRREPD